MARVPWHVTSRKRSPVGFTLIEMLTAIGIIMVVAAISIPAFFRVRGAARKSKCNSNMRQLAMATELYVQDHDDRLPMTRHNRPWEVHPVVPWYDAIDPYTRNKAICRCPDLAAHDVNIGPTCAVFTISGDAGTRAVFQFDDPTSTFLFGDISDERHGDPPYYTHQPERLCSTEICENPAEVHLAPRHGGKLNVAFLDGHVKLFALEEACSEKIAWGPATAVDGSGSWPRTASGVARQPQPAQAFARREM